MPAALLTSDDPWLTPIPRVVGDVDLHELDAPVASRPPAAARLAVGAPTLTGPPPRLQDEPAPSVLDDEPDLVDTAAPVRPLDVRPSLSGLE